MARPTKYTDEFAEQIAKNVSAGLTNKDAALVAGINEHTLINWAKRYSHFSHLLAQAHAKRSARWLAKLQEAGAKDWRAYAELLDRCAPEYRKSQNVNIRVIAEKVASDFDLDPAEVMAEAERILSGAK